MSEEITVSEDVACAFELGSQLNGMSSMYTIQNQI